jgi:tetratricopeptide (TPR) repeat protein
MRGLLLLLCAAWVGSARFAAAQDTINIPPVIMTLHPDKAEYWVGEPVALRVRLHNWALPGEILYGAFGLQGGSDMRIFHNGEMSERYFAHLDLAPPTTKPVLVPYGKYYEFLIIALYEHSADSRLAFSEPGTYELQMRQSLQYMDTDTPQGQVPFPVTAAAPRFRVVEPPANAAGALKLLQSYPEVFYDLNRVKASPATRPILEKIAKEYPDSRYAPYCLHALGMLSMEMMDSIPGEQEKAEEALRKVIEGYPNYPLRNEARVDLGNFYSRTDRYNKGQEMAGELLSESEDNLFQFRTADIMAPYSGSRVLPNMQMNKMNWELFGTTRLPDTYDQLQLEQLN